MTDDPQVLDGTIAIDDHTPELPLHIKSIAEHHADIDRRYAIRDAAVTATALLSLLVLAGIFAVVIGGIGGAL